MVTSHKRFVALGSILLTMVGTVSVFILRDQIFRHDASTDLSYATVRIGPIERFERVTGHVVALKKRKLSFPSSGVLRALHVETGAFVRAKQILAELAPDAEQTEKLIAARLTLSMSDRRLRAAQDVLMQERALYEAGIVSARAVQKEERTVTEEQDRQQRAQLTLRSLEEKASLSRLRADADAQVIAIDLVPGQSVSSAAGITLITPNTLVIEARVDEAIAAQLKLGQAAHYDVMSMAEKKVVAISSIVRISPVFERMNGTGNNAGDVSNGMNIRVGIAAAHLPLLRLGQQVQLSLQVESHPKAILVPTRAIVVDRGQQYLLVLSDNQVQWVPIETGIEQRDVTEIRTNTIVAGMRVVIPGATPPSRGQKVKAHPI